MCVCVCECISKCALYSCVYFSPCCTECVSYPLGDSRCADRSHWSDKRTNSVYCCEDSYLRPGGGRRRSPTGQGVIMHCHCYTRDEVTLIDTGGGWRERQTDRQTERNLRPRGGRRRPPTDQGVIKHCLCYTIDEVKPIIHTEGMPRRCSRYVSKAFCAVILPTTHAVGKQGVVRRFRKF